MHEWSENDENMNFDLFLIQSRGNLVSCIINTVQLLNANTPFRGLRPSLPSLASLFFYQFFGGEGQGLNKPDGEGITPQETAKHCNCGPLGFCG